MIDPRDITFSNKSRSGRQIYWIKQKMGSDEPEKVLWTGSGSKILKEQQTLMWKILCSQAEKIESLEAQLSNPNLVLLEQIE